MSEQVSRPRPGSASKDSLGISAFGGAISVRASALALVHLHALLLMIIQRLSGVWLSTLGTVPPGFEYFTYHIGLFLPNPVESDFCAERRPSLVRPYTHSCRHGDTECRQVASSVLWLLSLVPLWLGVGPWPLPLPPWLFQSSIRIQLKQFTASVYKNTIHIQPTLCTETVTDPISDPMDHKVVWV